MQTVLTPKRMVPLFAVFAVLGALFLAGCGNNDAASTAAMTPAPTAAPHTAASGAAVTDKLSIDQLTLDSPIKNATDKNGLVFLHFKYTDNDGKVYECVLPKAMSEGQYTINEWVSTFNAYRLPKVIAQKKVKKNMALGDFPFISPKPQEQPKTEPQNPQRPNVNMPTLPTMPSAPSSPTGPVSSMPAGPAAPMPPPP